MMLTLKDLGKMDDGGAWQKMKEEIEAETDDPNEQLQKLTERVLLGFINSLGKGKGEAKRQEGHQNVNVTTNIKRIVIIGPKRPVKVIAQPEYDQGIVPSKKGTKPKRGLKSKNVKKKMKKEKAGRRARHPDPNKELMELGLEPPRDMPDEFKNVIRNLGGSQIMLVMQKIIYPTDLSRSHNRLQMPKKQFRSVFLSEAEAEAEPNKFIKVKLVEPCLRVSEIHFGKWLLATDAYVFRTEWNDVLRNNQDTFKEKAVVQIWSFREGPESRLGFAIVKLRDGIS